MAGKGFKFDEGDDAGDLAMASTDEGPEDGALAMAPTEVGGNVTTEGEKEEAMVPAELGGNADKEDGAGEEEEGALAKEAA